MSLMESLIADVERHESDLKRRLDELVAETNDTRKLLREVIRHRERLTRDRSRGIQALPGFGEPAGASAVERELDEEEDASEPGADDLEVGLPEGVSPELAEQAGAAFGEAFDVPGNGEPEPEPPPEFTNDKPKRGRRRREAAASGE